jgi:NAD(P)-dependent dehydrogenase (short-subunit alcohol dehydrogenase family)
MTFGVNHLAHYLLARLLLPRIAEGGRLVITASGLHDPAFKTPVPTPRQSDAERLAHPETDPNLDAKPSQAGFRAYSTSKLLNVMTARSIAALPEVRARRIAVHAYDPGFIPETGLKRDGSLLLRAGATLLSILPPMKIANRLKDGAAGLAGLADGSISSDRLYMSLRQAKPTWPDEAAMARDDAACAKLWSDSAAMVGLAA